MNITFTITRFDIVQRELCLSYKIVNITSFPLKYFVDKYVTKQELAHVYLRYSCMLHRKLSDREGTISNIDKYLLHERAHI